MYRSIPIHSISNKNIKHIQHSNNIFSNNANVNCHSKKNILRKIIDSKVKKAFPKGFFEG